MRLTAVQHCHPEPAQRGEGPRKRHSTPLGKIAPSNVCGVPRSARDDKFDFALPAPPLLCLTKA
ncbi:MAG: hypothetical protein H0X40_13780 [Chthoniobacterales bacterium]|nr:hypothetical protein [Chthoniobacterales bacterium]